MMSHPDRTEAQKVTIEALLRLKRSERPAPEFWDRFEQQLRAKQLAAIIEKRPWWIVLRLPRAMGFLARFQLPAGAAAVLALGFVVIREYRPFSSPDAVALTPVMHAVGSQVSVSPEVVASVMPAHTSGPVELIARLPSALVPDAALEPVSERVADGGDRDADASVSVGPGGLLAMIPWAAPEAKPVSGAPIQQFVVEELPQVNFASFAFAGREHDFEGRVEVDPVIMPAPVASQHPGTLAQATASLSSREMRRSRILSNLVIADNAPDGERSRLGQVREVLTSALDDDRLYDSVRRLGMGGDRLTLKF
jgi:hypothetical protein